MSAPGSDRFAAMEWALAIVLAASVAVHHFVTTQFAPLLRFSYDELGMAMTLPMQQFFALVPWTSGVVIVLALLCLVFAAVGRPWPARVRRLLLAAATVVVTVGTLGGLDLVADQAVVHLARMTNTAEAVLVKKDLLALRASAGSPEEVIATLDSGHTRDYPLRHAKSLFAPVDAIRLADAYAQTGDVEAARRIYGAAKESAAAFDQLTTEQAAKRAAIGMESGWGPSEKDVKTLSALVRTVADMRIAELAAR